VAERLAACGQVGGPIRSFFWWDGRQDQAQEWYCVLKTTAARFPDVETRIRQLHSYQNPEIIAVAITHASQAYANWVADSVASPGTSVS
jgi:periplasmic divalent cation tolerance protein